MDFGVFEGEWCKLDATLIGQGVNIQCFYVSEHLMPDNLRRVVFKQGRRTIPVEVAPWLTPGKYAFEAYRNEPKED